MNSSCTADLTLTRHDGSPAGRASSPPRPGPPARLAPGGCGTHRDGEKNPELPPPSPRPTGSACKPRPPALPPGAKPRETRGPTQPGPGAADCDPPTPARAARAQDPLREPQRAVPPTHTEDALTTAQLSPLRCARPGLLTVLTPLRKSVQASKTDRGSAPASLPPLLTPLLARAASATVSGARGTLLPQGLCAGEPVPGALSPSPHSPGSPPSPSSSAQTPPCLAQQPCWQARLPFHLQGADCL